MVKSSRVKTAKQSISEMKKEQESRLLAEKKKNWIDFDASPIAFGEDPDETGKRLLDLVLEIANGKQTKTEEKNYREISIWKDGVFL